MKILFLFIMLFLHIIDDYYLQGILAKLKQESFWVKNAKTATDVHRLYKLYKYDYIMALIEHSFSWTFMIMLPVTYLMLVNNQFSIFYIIVFVLNMAIHGITDHLKANLYAINLITDQSIHIFQVIITWIIFII